jgi:hypothetical protein
LKEELKAIYSANEWFSVLAQVPGLISAKDMRDIPIPFKPARHL